MLGENNVREKKVLRGSFELLSVVLAIVVPRFKVVRVSELRTPNWIQIGRYCWDILLVSIPLVCSAHLSPLVKFFTVMSEVFLFILFESV